MKKMTSLLLALVMMLSMLPGAAVPVTAAGEKTVAPTQNGYYSNAVLHETFDDINVGMTRGKVGSEESRNYITQVTGGAWIRTGDPTAGGNDEIAIANISPINGDFELTFTADFTKLETGAAGSTAGFSVDVRVTEQGLRCRYIFSSDAAGNIYVTMEHAKQWFDTGADEGDTDVKVRIVVDEARNASVVVDGQYVGRFGAPTAKGSAGYYWLSAYCTASNSGANDVTLYDMKLAQGPVVVDDVDDTVVHETFDAIGTGMTRGKVGSAESRNYITQVEGGARFRTGVPTATGNDEVAIASFLDIPVERFEITFDADFHDLIVPATNESTDGFSVDVRLGNVDGKGQRCRYVFNADAAGNIYVSQYDDAKRVVRFDTGLDLPATDVNVRITADEKQNTTVLVNGRQVAQFTKAIVTGASEGCFIVYCGASGSTGRTNDVVLYDLKLVQAPVMQAYYTMNAPHINGTADERPWPFDGDRKIALLSDEEYLYIALRTSNPAPKFTINGVVLTTDLATGNVRTADGAWAGNAAKTSSHVEVQIPLKSVLGLDYAPGQKVNFDYKWGDAGFTGTVVLAGCAVVDFESYDGYIKDSDPSGEVTATQAGDGKLVLGTNTMTSGGKSRSVLLKQLDTVDMDFAAGMTLEFTADFNDLIIPKVRSGLSNYNAAGNWGDAGFVIDLRMDPCHRYGFHADASGNIYVTQKMNSYSQVTRIDTGLNLPATDVDVKLVSDASGVTTVYINGAALTEKLPASTFQLPATGGRGYYQLYNSTANRANDNRKNNVTLYDMVLTQNVPAARVVEYPLGSENTKDITAYLNTSEIRMDGVPGEPAWYLTNSVAGSGAAPGGMMGIGWGDGNLYVGGETTADSVSMSIGGKKVSATLRPAPDTAVGQVAASSNGFEWIIPLSAFGLSNGVLAREMNYTLTATKYRLDSGLTGKLTFSGEQILFGDPGRNYTAKEYATISGQGHVTWKRTDDGVSVTSQKLNDPKSVGGSFGQQRLAKVDYDSGAFNLEVKLTINQLPAIADVFGQRGLHFQVWSDDVQAPIAIYNDGKDNVMMAMRYHYGDERYDTGLNIGDTATIRLEVDAKHIPTLYVDGKLVHTFSPFDRRNVNTQGQPVPNFIINPHNTHRALNADGTLDSIDVVLHDVLLTQTPFMGAQDVVDAALEQIDSAFVVAEGTGDDVAALNLPRTIVVDTVEVPVDVSWTAIDKLTGRLASGVDLSTGEVTRSAGANAFDLIAVVTYSGASGTKTIPLQVLGNGADNGSVALLVDDANPASGAVKNWSGNRYAYFDTTHNSLVVNRGASSPFNRIVLRDSDDYSRVSARHLGVFVSNDNITYRKVNGWLLHQDGRTYTIYNLNETAQYVKVHTYHDDLDVTGEKPTFYNKVSDMIKVSNEKYLPGAREAFDYSSTFRVGNDTDKEKLDTPVFVSLTTLGAKVGQYRESCPDFRFTVGEITLAHWYNGKDGFYVRVPSIPAKGETTVTAHWGSSTAADFSDGETTFEVTYGNVALIDLSKETHTDNGQGSKQQGTGMGTHGRPFTFPNGDVIVVARRIETDADIAVFRSTDGGHTFDKNPVLAYKDGNYKSRGSGFGGFLWDESVGDKGRLYLITYNGKVGNATDYRIVLTYTDDYGYTWSEPEFLNLPGSELVQKSSAGGGGNAKYQELGNSGAYFLTDTFAFKRVITYCDGLKMEKADGAGPNVDYVIIIAGEGYTKTADQTVQDITDSTKVQSGSSKVTSLYSTDGGVTWNCANNAVEIKGLTNERNPEDGLSEAGFAQLDDGRLFLTVRSQMEGNYYMHECISTDFGKTWTGDFGNILASNTSPVLTKYGEERLMTWAACNGLSQISYRRTPMHVGLSTDNYETFDKILDVTFATSFDAVREIEGRHTQPGLAISPDGKNAFISYFDHSYFYHVWEEKMYEYVGTVGFLMEDFDQMIHKTKGAWDDFEDSSLKFQGWLCDREGTILLSREQAVSGRQSMKVLDENMGAPTHAVRQLPSMKSGTVGAKLMVPKTNESEFVMELKAAYNFTHMLHTIAAFSVTPSGTVYVWNGSNKVAVTTVVAGSWNDYALDYDVNTGKGVLYVNGKPAGDAFTLPGSLLEKDIDLVHGVTAVSFNQIAGTSKNGDCLYVDDFYANELATVARSLEETTVPSVLGRFMTIVRKVIEVNGERVELVEWGWVPGL